MSTPALPTKLPAELATHFLGGDPLKFASADIQAHVDSMLASVPDHVSEVSVQVGFGPGGPGFYEAGLWRVGDNFEIKEGAGWNRVDGFQAQVGATVRW